MLFELLFERFSFDEKYLNNTQLFINDYGKKKLKPKLTKDEKFLKNNEIVNKIYICIECLNDDKNKRINFIKIKNILNQIKGEDKKIVIENLIENFKISELNELKNNKLNQIKLKMK
jgi:hypothetical protein